MTTDEIYMRRCLQLARHGYRGAAPNPMVGAVLVCNDVIIGEGWHRHCGGPHAEVNCFASVTPGNEHLIERSTLYVSLEPCSHYGKTPPCCDLIISKRPRRVVTAMTDPNPKVAGKGIERLRAAGIEVCVGVLEHESRQLNRRFLSLHERHRPYVTLKWAQTADGFIDYNRLNLEHRQPLLVSNDITKVLVHQIRANNMAILVGARTAVLDDPKLLTTRWTGSNPLRCVIDSHHQLPQYANLNDGTAQTLVFDTLPDLRTQGAEAWSIILDTLAQRGIHSLMVEGGAVTLQSAIDNNIWDEAQVEVSEQNITQGVKAPVMPCLPISNQQISGHTLYHFTNENTHSCA